MARPVVRRFLSVGLDFQANDLTGRRTGDMRIAFRDNIGGTSFDQPSSFIPLRLSTVNRFTYDVKKSWHSVFRPAGGAIQFDCGTLRWTMRSLFDSQGVPD
jgi:hypothetical protein